MNSTKKFGWMHLIIGILFILLAFFIFLNPSTALIDFVILFGVIAVAKGIFGLIVFFSLKQKTNNWLWIILGIAVIDLIVGVILLTNVYAGIVSISIFIPIWLLISSVDAIVEIRFAKEFDKIPYWVGFTLYTISIALAILLLFQPATAVLTFAYMLGFYALFYGFASIMQAFEGDYLL